MEPEECENEPEEPPIEDIPKKRLQSVRPPLPTPVPEADWAVNPLTKKVIRKTGALYTRLVKTGHISDPSLLAQLSQPKTGTRSTAQLEALVEKAVAARMAAPAAPTPVPTPEKREARFEKKATKMLTESKSELNAMPEAKARREVRERLAAMVLDDSTTVETESEYEPPTGVIPRSKPRPIPGARQSKPRASKAQVKPLVRSDSDTDYDDSEPEPETETDVSAAPAKEWVPRAIAEYKAKPKASVVSKPSAVVKPPIKAVKVVAAPKPVPMITTQIRAPMRSSAASSSRVR